MKISKPFFIFILIFIPLMIGLSLMSSKNDNIMGIGVELITLSIAFIIIFTSNSNKILLPTNFKKLNFKSIGCTFFIGLLSYFLVICMTLIFSFFKIGDFSVVNNYVSINFLTVIENILVAPICEELLFRVAILGLLAKKFPAHITIIIQACIFAFMHCFSFTSVKFFISLTGGIIYGYIIYNTKSILLSILAHSFYNSSATIHIAISNSNSFYKNSTLPISLISIFIGIICFIAIIYLLKQVKRT